MAIGADGGTSQMFVVPSAAASRFVMKHLEHIVSPCPNVDLIQSCFMVTLACVAYERRSGLNLRDLFNAPAAMYVGKPLARQ